MIKFVFTVKNEFELLISEACSWKLVFVLQKITEFRYFLSNTPTFDSLALENSHQIYRVVAEELSIKNSISLLSKTNRTPIIWFKSEAEIELTYTICMSKIRMRLTS